MAAREIHMAGAQPARRTLGLVAHDRMKEAMIAWARRWDAALTPLDLLATGTTGARLLEALPSLHLTLLLSGPLGGDQQLGALIAERRVDGLIFLVDPLSPHPHDVDVKALIRVATLVDIPFACNLASADAVMRACFVDPDSG